MMAHKRHRYSSRAAFFALLFLSWASVFYLILAVHPLVLAPYYYTPLLVSLEIALSISGFLLTNRWPVALLAATALVAVLGLRLFDFKQWYYAALTLALAITLIYFFTATDKNDTVNDESSIDKSHL